jgi:hypothetical protein
LHEVTAAASNTPAGANVTVPLPNGGSVTYCRVTRAGTTFGSTVKNPFSPETPTDPLLAGFDLDGPSTPSGLARQPSNLFVLWSSALWGQDCPGPSLARVRLPVPAGVLAPRLLEMRWNGGEFVWRDITTSVQPAARTIEGEISSSYLGVLSVAGIETGR